MTTLQSQFAYLGRRSNPDRAKAASGGTGDDFGGEYANVLEQEYFDFVLFEIPWIVL